MRILAVCAGNTCRSPAAEAAIKEAARARGLEVEVDSAGTGSWNIGQAPHPQIVSAGGEVGLRIGGRARKVTVVDFNRFDVIVAMDKANLRDLASMAPSLEARAKVRLFRTYDPDSDLDEIPDPWGGSDEDYEETIRLVQAAAAGLMESLVGVQDSVTPD